MLNKNEKELRRPHGRKRIQKVKREKREKREKKE